MPHHAKALFALYFLGAVITFTFVLGECVSIMVEVARSRRLAKLFEKGLTEDLLNRMDAFHNGEVRTVPALRAAMAGCHARSTLSASLRQPSLVALILKRGTVWYGIIDVPGRSAGHTELMHGSSCTYTQVQASIAHSERRLYSVRPHAFHAGVVSAALRQPANPHASRAQVSRAEFMMFMLQQLGLVDKSELDNVLEMFDAVDTNGDGVLDLTDVRRRMRESRATSVVGGSSPRSAAGPSEEAV